jgi:hypothetical protein
MITEYLNVKETMRKQSEGKTRDEARWMQAELNEGQ